MIIDTHAHLDFPELCGDLQAVMRRAAENGVGKIITIGISIDSSRKAIALAEKLPDVYATIGIHPHGATELTAQERTQLRSLAGAVRVVAIGEIGLDYYRDRQPRAIQRQCFRRQLEIACETKLPAVFHVREAYSDFLKIVTDYAELLPAGVMHCFSGDWQVAQECLDLGFYLSIPGTVTFPKAQVQQEVARKLPLDRLLLETDAPCLAPVPYRGQANEPSYLIHTLRKVAQLRGCGEAEITEATCANAARAFALPI